MPILQDRPYIPDPDTVTNLAIGGASARVALPSGADVVRISSDVACYYLLGDSSVTVASNTGVYLPAGVEIIAIGNHTYIAVIQDAAAGNLNIVTMK